MAKVQLTASAEVRSQILQLIAIEQIENGKTYTIKSYLEYLVSQMAERYRYPGVTIGHQLSAGQFAMKVQIMMAEINAANLSTPAALDDFHRLYLGRQSLLANLFNDLVRLPPAQKTEVGQLLNKIKQGALERFDQAQAALENNE